MTSGQKHDKATIYLCVPFALLTGILFGKFSGIIAGAAFIVSGLWLSPDLDIYSKSLKRWGILKFVWFPYRKMIGHRSYLSHGPFIGSAIRITYILLIAYAVQIIFQFLGIDIRFISISQLIELIEKFPKQIFSIIIGIEASAWLHIFLDGDPLPIEWNKKK